MDTSDFAILMSCNLVCDKAKNQPNSLMVGKQNFETV